MLALPYSDLLIIVSVSILGFLAGGLSNVTSGGAGILTIYLLTNYAGMVIQKSTGTVLAASTLIVLIGAYSFYRKKQVDTQLAITVGISGVVGAFFAARWASSIESVTFEHIFGAFTLVLAAYMTLRFVNEWKKSRYKGQALVNDSPNGGTAGMKSQRNLSLDPVGNPAVSQVREVSRWAGRDPLAISVQIAKGVLIGIATGLFGVGLASLSIVLFMLLFKLDTKMILGTSLFASFFRYLGGSAGYLSTGQIDPFYFGVIVLAGCLGSYIGARVVLGSRILPGKGRTEKGESGGGIKDVYVKIIVVAILVFISYEFLFR